MKRILWICLLVFGLILGWTLVYAGDFYVIPVKGKFTSWDKKISGSTRFKLVLDGNAALDRETGLVWEKSPDSTTRSWTSACSYCYQREVSNRKGWRLPTVEELASLVDNDNSNPALPTGHPFTNVQSYYWSSTTSAGLTSWAYRVLFGDGHVGTYSKSAAATIYVWCVRGGYGHDAY